MKDRLNCLLSEVGESFDYLACQCDPDVISIPF